MKEVRFAFIGLGNIAKTHIVALKALPVLKQLPFLPVLDTLITRNPKMNQAQAHAMGFVHISTSLDESLQTQEIDIVDICTPNAMHLDAVKIAVGSNKAIYCEKPLTENYGKSLRLVSLVPSGLLQQTALVFRYHPAVMRIREMLRHQQIGEVLQCQMSYRRSGYLNPHRPLSWRLDDVLSGGGAITDLGVHVLDLFRHLFGEIESVQGQTRIHVKKRPTAEDPNQWLDSKVDDWAQMHVSMVSGIQGTAEVSRIAWGAEALEIQIYGTRGSITCDLEKDMFPNIKLLNGSSPVLPSSDSLQLVPDEKSTMGVSMDCHFGALNHFLHRYVGEDQWPDLAPSLNDCLLVEHWIDQVLQC